MLRFESKRVWYGTRQVEKGDGTAWLYFIFGICQWLPTQYRVNRHRVDKNRIEGRGHQVGVCVLCQSGDIENLQHVWVCPAMAKEQHDLQTQVDLILRESFPFGKCQLESRQSRTRRAWLKQAKALPSVRVLPEDRVVALTRDFWKSSKPNKAFQQQFRSSLRCRTEPRLLSAQPFSLFSLRNSDSRWRVVPTPCTTPPFSSGGALATQWIGSLDL